MLDRLSKLIDAVALAHRSLMERTDYQRYWVATDDAGAVEGSQTYDTYAAATMVREWAEPASELAKAKLHPIAEALIAITGRKDRAEAMRRSNNEATLERLDRILDDNSTRQ